MTKIDFRCPNLVADGSGTDRPCRQRLRAEAQFVGQQVRCPRCQQFTTIPPTSDPGLAHSEARSPAAVRPATVGSESGRTGSAKAAAGETQSHSGASDSDPDSGFSKQLSFGRFDPFTRCPRCGGLLDNRRRCTECRYFFQDVMDEGIALDEIEIKPAGCLYFLQRRLTGVSLPAVVVIIHLVFAIAMFTLAMLAILGGTLAMVMILPLVFVTVVLYCVAAIQLRRLHRQPAVQLNVWQRFLWDAILFWLRSRNWKNPFEPQKSLKILDLRGQELTDEDLLLQPGLDKQHVIDLEGSPITDRALAALRSPALQYLVLKRTDVSIVGIFRLQQANRQTWIWY